MNGIRSFIAIELPSEIKEELSTLQTMIKRASTCPAKWVPPEAIHLTLCFLGEISQGQIEAVKSVMALVAPRCATFNLELTRPGAFPNLHQPQTIWVGLQGGLKSLSSLYLCLEDNLRATGYRPESRPFKPHLTLARVRDEASPVDRQNLGEALNHICLTASKSFNVRDISLMRSQLSPNGAVYSRLFSASLAFIH